MEQEMLGFTNWLYINYLKLIGDGMCLNLETKAIGYVNELMVEYNKQKLLCQIIMELVNQRLSARLIGRINPAQLCHV